MIDTGKQSNIYKSSYGTNINYSNAPEIIEAPQSSTKKSNINLKNLSDQKVSKIQTQKKSKYLGRDEKIDPDQYYFVKDENERLKKEKLATNEKIKKMDVSLANIKAQLIKERQLYDQRLLNMDNPKFDKDYQTTKFENEKLKEQNTKLRTYIQGLQSNKKSVPNFNKSKQKKKKKSISNSKRKNK